MNKDQAGGTDKATALKTQERAGAVIVSTDQHAKGPPGQAEGRLHRASNVVKEALKNSSHK
ncbi:MAG: CsbD family protein [Ramlibacter sp.]